MTVIGSKYEIAEELGSGSQGKTYRATTADGHIVAIKELDLRSMAGWKSLELFEREVETLRSIDHDMVPTFIEAIRDDRACYLVQQFVEGESLDTIGKLPEAELRALTLDLLDVLEYLHTLVPPVVHRDVKPGNIIRRPDGTHALVDFGGVQNIVVSDTGGSTVIGTTGYMPSEQLIGRAVPQSDFYALGATLAHLSTGVHPADLPVKRLSLQWRDRADVSDELADFIDALLEPAPEDRPTDADAARAMIGTARTALTTVEPMELGELRAPLGCPSDIARRFRTAGSDALAIKLDPDPLRGIRHIAFGVTGAVFVAAVLADSTIMLIGAFLLVMVLLIGVEQLAQRERLVVNRDGSFGYEQGRGQTSSGALLDARVSSSGIRLRRAGGEMLIGEDLDHDEREWVAVALQNWLSSSGIASEPKLVTPEPTDRPSAVRATSVSSTAPKSSAALVPKPRGDLLADPPPELRARVRPRPNALIVAFGDRPSAGRGRDLTWGVSLMVCSLILACFVGPLALLLFAVGGGLLYRASRSNIGPDAILLRVDRNGSMQLRRDGSTSSVTGALTRAGVGLSFVHDEGSTRLGEALTVAEREWLCGQIHEYVVLQAESGEPRNDG